MAIINSWRDLRIPAWKISLTIIAILDMSTCWSVILDSWTNDKWTGSTTKESDIDHSHNKLDFFKYINKGQDAHIEICPATPTLPLSVIKPITFIFCCFCIIEAVIRAREARQVALENAALDNFEKKLARLYSTTRCNVFRQQPKEEDYNDAQQDLDLARNTIRVWSPVCSILTLLLTLLPWAIFVNHDTKSYECGNDSSLATLWINRFMSQISESFDELQSTLIAFLWKVVLPLGTLWYNPIRLFKRIKNILRCVRYFRYAGPLLRVGLKINDQFLVFTKTWRQTLEVKAEKAKRLAHRSMLFDDIRRIESFTKVQTALATIPSQLFQAAQEHAAEFDKILAKKREDAQKLKRKLEQLKRRAMILPSSEMYDRIVEVTQEFNATVSTAIFSSHLVSPQTRFSVGWRLIVTFALLTELFRLYASWYLSGTFEVSVTDMIGGLLVGCDTKMMERFRQKTKHAGGIRRAIGKLFRLKNVEYAKCMPTSPSSWVFLRMGTATEMAIDIVCFLDIFVWFFTGELDKNGVVVPKPFFSRCILPGTLVQVLDHPTLPDKLPHLIYKLTDVSHAIGYGRVIRWALSIYPTIEMLIIEPIKLYLFRPMNDDEYLRYTESLGLVPAFSNANILSTSSADLLRRQPSGGNVLFRKSSLQSFPSLGMMGIFKQQSEREKDDFDDSYALDFSIHY